MLNAARLPPQFDLRLLLHPRELRPGTASKLIRVLRSAFSVFRSA